MRIIISPAKKMNIDTDSFDCHGLPLLLPKTERLLARLRELTYDQLKALWRCNDQIAGLNFDRLQKMDLYRNLTPAILAYDGIQYQYMAPGVFTYDELAYIEEHLRILSGFYGVLRPFDGVAPYRLEMQAKLEIDGQKGMYAFWGSDIAGQLSSGSGLIVNLASKEYSRCVADHLPPDAHMLTCIFGELQGDKVVEKGTLCKMARGEMVRFMAEHQVQDVQALKTFDRLGYRFCPERSDESNYVFMK